MTASDEQLRVLELFAGIGGCAAALGDAARVVAAVDIHAAALAVYRHNFAHPTICRTIESLPPAELAQWDADLWWLSPPCQPYTRKGKQRDLDDPRTAALLHLVDAMQQVRPRYVALENVPPFGQSQVRARLVAMLQQSGYDTRETLLSPCELGLPNRRQRYYLLASRDHPLCAPAARPQHKLQPLASFVDRSLDDDPQWELPAAAARQYAGAIDVVDLDDPHATTSCFTAAYGRSVVRSGSYLRTRRGLRRFAPHEMLRLLGFPRVFRLPSGLCHRRAWRLVGNSLSVPAVRELLSAIVGRTTRTPCGAPID